MISLVEIRLDGLVECGEWMIVLFGGIDGEC